jgi:hypothetical protein
MTDDGFQKIEVPRGQFIGWGKLGQRVTLAVLDFDETGGTDFNGNTCPKLTGTLVEDCDNYRNLKKGGEREVLKRGEMVAVDGGTANLRKGLLLAEPKRDDIVRLTFTDEYETPQGTGKVIEVEIARGAAKREPVQDVGEDDI